MSMRKKIPITDYPNHEEILRLFPTTTHFVLNATWGAGGSAVGCQAISLTGVKVGNPSIVDAGGNSTMKAPESFIMVGGLVRKNPLYDQYIELCARLFKETDGLTYKALADTLWKSNDYNMYILGDNLMSGAGTQKFAQWLIDNEYGIVTSSPGVINRCHRSDPHFCQVWIWVPPQATRFCVPARKPVVGMDKMDPDAIVGQKMVLDNGADSENYRVQPHEKWHKDINFVKRALVLSKAEMTPKRMVRKKKIS